MPIQKIEVNEYECSHCGYKWINRINYKDGPIPTNCAKCKRQTWNHNPIGPKENGYRRIIRGFKKLYDDFDRYTLGDKEPKINWPADLCDQFLNMNPKPSWFDLEKVIQSSQLRRFDNGKSIYRRRGWVPDLGNPGHFIRDPSTWEPVPDKPGYVRWKKGVYDDSKFVSLYDKWIMKEAHVRKTMMILIMKYRGIDYKPVTNARHLKKDQPDKYMSREEKLWRRRINEFHKRYVEPQWYARDKNGNRIDARIYTNWPMDLCQKFLSIKPRPTVEEMKDIFYNPNAMKQYHKLVWDHKAEAKALLKKLPSMSQYATDDILSTIRRKKLMIRVVESRGEKFTYNEDLNLKILQDRFPIKANE